MSIQLLYIAAHGGFANGTVPLGGGAAVCDHLIEEWSRTRPFPFRLISPGVLCESLLGGSAPTGDDLVRFGERDYARFSRDFERAATAEVLRHDPAKTVVLANDISEGPDFQALAERGYHVYTIYHVDVVGYVSAMYCRGWIRPETTVRWHPRLRMLLPKMARLVWEKQRASVEYSRGLIMPSEGMREVLLRCYPNCPPDRVHVLPWGAFDVAPHGNPEPLRSEFNVPSNAHVLLTLSRISPEKGQDLLLETLIDWERRDDFPQRPVWLFICGDAAFMQGQCFLEKLKRLASKLRKTHVVFPGHVTGDRKAAFFALADLFVFPSRYESYGLTLLEALAHGLPAVCLDHHGSRAVMRREFGAIVQPQDLRPALQRLLADGAALQKMGEAARTFAQGERFSDRAAELAQLLLSGS